MILSLTHCAASQVEAQVHILLSNVHFRVLGNLYIFVTNVYNLLYFIGISFIF